MLLLLLLLRWRTMRVIAGSRRLNSNIVSLLLQLCNMAAIMELSMMRVNLLSVRPHKTLLPENPSTVLISPFKIVLRIG